MSEISAVCFDFDGTLIDSNTLKREFFFEFFSEYSGGSEFISGVLASETVYDRYEIFELFRSRFDCSRDFVEKAVCEFNEGLRARIMSAPLMKGVQTCLRDLRCEHINFFINSATPENELKEIVLSRSEFSEVSAVLGRPRTKAENVCKIAYDAKINPNQIVLVGDGEDDRLGAEEAGCKFIPVFSYSGQVIPDINPLQDLSLLVSIIKG